MKAAVLKSPRNISEHPLSIEQVPQPAAKPGEVLSACAHAAYAARTCISLRAS
jgi:NADPH:quinone reductase-like Zn-dependent oxidoreductase